MGLDAGGGLYSSPSGVGIEGPGQTIVGELDIDDPLDVPLERRILDRHQRLDPSIEITGHEVGRTDVGDGTGTRSMTEVVDPRMLEIATDDGSHPDGLRQAGNTRTQTADAADDEIDARTRL